MTFTAEFIASLDEFCERNYGPLPKRRPQVAGCVYFVQEGTDGPIKIGWATRVSRRLASMQTGNARPLRVLGAIVTRDRKLERTLHDRFQHLRIAGEWFKPAPDLLRFIEERKS